MTVAVIGDTTPEASGNMSPVATESMPFASENNGGKNDMSPMEARDMSCCGADSEIQILDSRFWILESRFWISDSGFQILDS